MRYLGDYSAGSTLYFDFSTHKADGTPITLVDGVVSVYKDDSDTQSVQGVALSVGIDSVTGLHNVKIICTDAFYAAGSDYSVVLTAGTVDSVSVVGYVLATFSIEHRSTAAIKTNVDSALADTNELQADWVNGGRLDLLIDAIKAKTDTSTQNTVWTDAKAGYLTGGVALEATLTALKGAGWTAETLKAIYDVASGATPAPGTIDETAIVNAIIEQLRTATVSVKSFISRAGDMQIVKGVTYDTTTTQAEVDIENNTAVVVATDTPSVNIAGTVFNATATGTTTVTVVWNMSEAQTLALPRGQHNYSIIFKRAGKTIPEIFEGNVFIQNIPGTE